MREVLIVVYSWIVKRAWAIYNLTTVSPMEPVPVIGGYSMGSAPSKLTEGAASKKSSSRLSSRKTGTSYYSPATFLITAYLPYDGGKRLKVRGPRCI